MKTPIERFENLYIPEPNSGCWLWLGCLYKKGYGNFSLNDKNLKAHRAAYLFFIGNIPPDYEIDHLCKMTSCVNPQHLEAVTGEENRARSNYLPNRNKLKTHCEHGHPFSGDNLIVTNNRRDCLICSRRRARESYYRNRIFNLPRKE